MENLDNFNNKQKYPFQSQHIHASDKDSRENKNPAHWDDQRDDTGTDPNGYNTGRFERAGNDNSGGAGSSGSAATNS